MKATFAVVLAALLCTERVSSLICFHCDNAKDNWGCMNVKTCANDDSYCTTKYFGGSLGEKSTQYISKGCSPSCSDAGVDLGVMAISMKCCKTSLCNSSGAVSVKSSSLMLAVGALLSLFYILGAKL